MAFVLDSVSAASVMVLVVLGMSIVVSMMGVFNLAHGQFVLLGAVGYLVLTEHGISGAPAIVSVVLAAAALGAIIEAVILRRLYRDPISTVLATFGIGLIVTGLVRQGIGSTARGLDAPVGGVVTLADHRVETWRIWILGIALVVVVAVFWLIEHTTTGLKIRATLYDHVLARVNGVRTRYVFTLTFALGTALAALAGSLIAPLTSVFPELGVSYLVLSFLAVMVGGAGTFLGPVVGAALLAICNVALARYVSPTYATVLIVVGAVVFMRIRPYGLLGQPQRVMSKEI
jgi:branched-chain amino acid transport system permease protein